MASGISVWRGGVTSAAVRREFETNAEMRSDWRWAAKGQERGIVISFAIASKGGGRTALQVWVAPSEFKRLARLMTEVDGAAAKTAFQSALKHKASVA